MEACFSQSRPCVNTETGMFNSWFVTYTSILLLRANFNIYPYSRQKKKKVQAILFGMVMHPKINGIRASYLGIRCSFLGNTQAPTLLNLALCRVSSRNTYSSPGFRGAVCQTGEIMQSHSGKQIRPDQSAWEISASHFTSL